MTHHPAIAQGRVAVITGAASGIGLAAAKRFAGLGLKVCIADVDGDALEAAANEVRKAALTPEDVLAVQTDVSSLEAVQVLHDRVMSVWHEVAVLMNNAGTSGANGDALGDRDTWIHTLSTNFMGVLNGVQTFVPAMIAQGTPCMVVNTGSKQGITCPPGNTAYNVSKAGIKVLTEGLQHDLRNSEGCKVSAHLLVPGFTYTGMISKFIPEQPPAAWSPDQVVGELLERSAKGDFYIICPDNDVSYEEDAKRIRWAAEDVAANRPPLTRWHPDYADAFKDFKG